MSVDQAVRLLVAIYDWAELAAKDPTPRHREVYSSYLVQCLDHDSVARAQRNAFHGYGEFADDLAWANQQRRLGSKR